MPRSAPSVAEILAVRPERAPRRRFRGQARYYRQRMAEAREPLHDPTGWFALWHHHADMAGYGNLSARHRRAHLEAHCAFFRRAAADLAVRTEPFQLWLFLCDADAGRDAVYVHTPNPNATPFPVLPRATVWGDARAEALLTSTFGMPTVRAGRDAGGDVFVYAPGTGVPLEATSSA